MSTTQIVGLVVFMLVFIGGAIAVTMTGNKAKPAEGNALQSSEPTASAKRKSAQP